MISKEKRFKSKIGSGFIISMGLLIVGVSALAIYTKEYNLLIIVPLLLLPIYTIFAMYYAIDGKELIIKAGPFYKLKITISSIYKVEETWGIIKSPAASTDRLEIFYEKFDSVMISPKNKMEFTNALKEINPGIEVKMKK